MLWGGIPLVSDAQLFLTIHFVPLTCLSPRTNWRLNFPRPSPYRFGEFEKVSAHLFQVYPPLFYLGRVD